MPESGTQRAMLENLSKTLNEGLCLVKNRISLVRNEAAPMSMAQTIVQKGLKVNYECFKQASHLRRLDFSGGL